MEIAIKALHELVLLTAELLASKPRENAQPVAGWMNDAQALSLKLFNHASSVLILSRGTEFSSSGNQKKLNLSFVDYASVTLIARAALENYLVFNHIYDMSDLERSEFRHSAWRLSGLMDRQKYDAVLPEHEEQKKSEAQTVYSLLEKIKADRHFEMLNDQEQKKLLKGKWRINLQWIDLALKAGLDERYFRQMYSHLCGYSHASYISTIQVGSSWKSYDDQKEMAERAAGVICGALANFVFDYCKFFPHAQEVLDAQPERKKIARSMSPTPEEWARERNRLESSS